MEREVHLNMLEKICTHTHAYACTHTHALTLTAPIYTLLDTIRFITHQAYFMRLKPHTWREFIFRLENITIMGHVLTSHL